MIEYVNSFLLLTLLGIIYYIYYKYKIFFHAINILIDSTILSQLNNLEKEVDFEVIKTRKGPKKKTDLKMLPIINEGEEKNIRDNRGRLVACVLSGNSKQYSGKEYTEQQINEMDSSYTNILSNRYESVLSAKMIKSLGKSVINLYSNIACSASDVGNQEDLGNDLECDPFLNTALQRFTCDLYYRFGALLAPISVGIILVNITRKIIALN